MTEREGRQRGKDESYRDKITSVSGFETSNGDPKLKTSPTRRSRLNFQPLELRTYPKKLMVPGSPNKEKAETAKKERTQGGSERKNERKQKGNTTRRSKMSGEGENSSAITSNPS